LKKRLSLIFILLIVSSALIFTSFAVNNKKNTAAENKAKTSEKVQAAKVIEEAKPQVKTSEEKPKAEVNTTEKKEEKPAAKTIVKPAVTAPKPAANVIFIHAADGKTIKSVFINFNGDTVFNYTLDALNELGQNPRPTQIDRVAGYFKGMLKYNERDEGPMSGWIYYVNGVKANKGSKDCNSTLKNGDKLVWKFVEDYTKY